MLTPTIDTASIADFILTVTQHHESSFLQNQVNLIPFTPCPLLMAYVIDSLAENSIRPFTVERRNWLFSRSPEGASASATAYSIIETEKANGLNPYEYLRFIFKYRLNKNQNF